MCTTKLATSASDIWLGTLATCRSTKLVSNRCCLLAQRIGAHHKPRGPNWTAAHALPFNSSPWLLLPVLSLFVSHLHPPRYYYYYCRGTSQLSNSDPIASLPASTQETKLNLEIHNSRTLIASKHCGFHSFASASCFVLIFSLSISLILRVRKEALFPCL